MKYVKPSNAGFTLIELMIAVAIIGVLAAIAMPAFAGYVRRSKTGEVTSNLKSLFTASAVYYNRQGAGMGVHATENFHCTVAPAGPVPAVPRASKQIGAFSADSSFAGLGFSVADPVYFSYTIAGSVDTCGNTPDTNLYSFRANGDLDGDGISSLFELAVASNSDNEVYHSPAFYLRDELE